VAGVDFCTRILLERKHVSDKELLLKEFRKQIVITQKELEKYREYFSNLLSTVKSLFELRSIVLNIFATQLAKIPDIEARYFTETPEGINIWMFIKKDNWKVEEDIYEAYGELLDLFPDTDINLRLLKLFERKPEELLPKGFTPW